MIASITLTTGDSTHLATLFRLITKHHTHSNAAMTTFTLVYLPRGYYFHGRRQQRKQSKHTATTTFAPVAGSDHFLLSAIFPAQSTRHPSSKRYPRQCLLLFHHHLTLLPSSSLLVSHFLLSFHFTVQSSFLALERICMCRRSTLLR